MASLKTKPSKVAHRIIDADNHKRDWIQSVTTLCDNIEKWANSKEWLVQRNEKIIEETQYGNYSVPELFLATPQGRLIVNPIGLDICGADGRVDFEAFPSLVRFVLLRKDNGWELLTEQGVRWPQKWGRNTFLDLAIELTRA
jgi:hypothetical protein